MKYVLLSTPVKISFSNKSRYWIDYHNFLYVSPITILKITLFKKREKCPATLFWGVSAIWLISNGLNPTYLNFKPCEQLANLSNCLTRVPLRYLTWIWWLHIDFISWILAFEKCKIVLLNSEIQSSSHLAVRL